MLEVLKMMAVAGSNSVVPASQNMARGSGSGGNDFLSAVKDVFENIAINFQMSTLFIGLGVTLLISIIVFVAIVESKKAPRLGFFRWLREYLNFRTMLIVGILKFLHLFLATAITVTGVIVMFQGGDDVGAAILVGLAIILVGNIVLRLISELFMLVISLWQNITDIRAVIVKDEEAPEEKTPKKPKEKHHKDKEKKEEAKVEGVVSETIETPVATETAVAVETPVVAETPVTAEAPVATEMTGVTATEVVAEMPTESPVEAPIETPNEIPVEAPVDATAESHGATQIKATEI